MVQDAGSGTPMDARGGLKSTGLDDGESGDGNLQYIEFGK